MRLVLLPKQDLHSVKPASGHGSDLGESDGLMTRVSNARTKADTLLLG